MQRLALRRIANGADGCNTVEQVAAYARQRVHPFHPQST